MMPSGWEGNRRSGVGLAMCDRLKWLIHLRAYWPSQRDSTHLHPASGLVLVNFLKIITFCVSHRRHKMYCGHARLCGLSVCPLLYAHTTAQTRM